MPQLKFFAAFLPLLFVAACVSDSGPEPTTSHLALPDRTSMVQTGDLRIGPMDMLNVSVFGVDELNGEYQVDTLGIVKLPLVGEISAKGYTAIEFSRELERRLGETYLQHPFTIVVSLSIAAATSWQLTLGILPVLSIMVVPILLRWVDHHKRLHVYLC